MELLIMPFSPSFQHFISLQYKYSPQHPVLEHPESVVTYGMMKYFTKVIIIFLKTLVPPCSV
jgi:hypothetical protein